MPLGAGTMAWEGAAGCALGHIVGEGIRLACTTVFGAKRL